jgi:hypothetical protein
MRSSPSRGAASAAPGQAVIAVSAAGRRWALGLEHDVEACAGLCICRRSGPAPPARSGGPQARAPGSRLGGRGQPRRARRLRAGRRLTARPRTAGGRADAAANALLLHLPLLHRRGLAHARPGGLPGAPPPRRPRPLPDVPAPPRRSLMALPSMWNARSAHAATSRHVAN